jgi:hypothetical protein
VLTTHAGTIRYAREADTLLFSRHAKQSRTCEPNDARFPQLPSFTFFAEIKFSVGTHAHRSPAADWHNSIDRHRLNGHLREINDKSGKAGRAAMEHDPEQLVSAYSTDQRARVLCPKSYRRNFAGAVQFLRFSLGARMDRKSNPGRMERC